MLTAQEEQCRHVLLRLENIEKIIERLFKLPDFLLGKVVLEKKLLQYEELIAELPDSAENQADQARAKVVAMWLRLNGNLETPDNAPNVATTDSGISNQADSTTCSGQSLDSDVKSSETGSDAESIQNAKVDSNTLSQSIESSFQQIEPIDSGADVDGIKTLLRELAYARKKIARCINDGRLKFDVFNMAFRKLPLKMREQFFSIYGSTLSGINLENLVALLQAEIVAQHSKTVWLINHKGPTSGKPSKSYWPGVENVPQRLFGRPLANYCKYCKIEGHNIDVCPNKKKLLCFKCYESGHIQTQCSKVGF